MPSRILREAILDSQRVNALSFPAEVFYRRLMSAVDDFGRFDARPGVLRGRLYPLLIDKVREADITRWSAECAKAGLIALYSVSGKQYLLFHNLGSPRAKESRFPPPPADVEACAHLRADENGCAQMRPYSGSGSGSGSEREEKKFGSQISCPETPKPASPGPDATPEVLEKKPPEESDRAPPVLTFPTDGTPREWPLLAAKLAEWQAAYPALDVAGECRKALQWLRDNPAKRKTAKGMPRFLGSWLGRAQDRGGGRGPPGANGAALGDRLRVHAARLREERERNG